MCFTCSIPRQAGRVDDQGLTNLTYVFLAFILSLSLIFPRCNIDRKRWANPTSVMFAWATAYCAWYIDLMGCLWCHVPFYKKWWFFCIFFSFEGFPILVLVNVLLQTLVPWNKYCSNIVLPVSRFFLVFLYYFDCACPDAYITFRSWCLSLDSF